MRLVTFDKDGRPTAGVRRDGAIVDLSLAAPDLPQDWPAIFAASQMARVHQVAETAGEESLRPEAEVTLLPPVTNPPKIICIGLNYRSHAEETGNPIPDYPVVFARWPRSLVGHGQPLVLPRLSEQFDYEAELAVVIGQGGRNIPVAEALDHVVGYSVFNDGSLRDYQFKGPQWTMGKNFDASGAFGPDIVTVDELPAGAKGLRIMTRLSGQVVQDSNIDDMIFDVPQLVATLSDVMTLEPGDVIATGTPPGVGLGRTPPLWKRHGDVCEVEIEGIGVLSNPVVAEDAA